MSPILVPQSQWLPSKTFAGQVALVTGGGTGLGLEISRGLAALGAHVAIASRNQAHHQAFLEEAQAQGWSVESLALDVREASACRDLIDGLVERHGKLDHLVNNAAGNFVCPSHRLSANAWRAVLSIVLDGTFYCSKHAGIHMLRQGFGTQLNIVATYAWTGMPGVVHSASAKAGVLTMTKTLAAEWAPYGIRVNAVAPGPFASEGAKGNLWPDDETEERIRRNVPMGRFATTQEVAAQCLWLMSPACAYVTGDCLTIDGGLSLGAGRLFADGQRPGKRDEPR
ncbi:MAG: SDR family oxidoreductase [Planctomycetes bacterium]|nr:SDR family oxidoreductase [Planctomycetota bacterium]MCB9910613.1 SDR family oxidoreductase [Planctomycetota bacterium]HPF13001.1 SDR family oxidoreductase [Planctomycetota bacterium]